MKRLHAIRALHLNYHWPGVWVWLKGRHYPVGERGWVRGWARVLRDPDSVITEQQGLAEGVFV